jgi:hypothetical protein
LYGDAVEQLAQKSAYTLWLQTFHGDDTLWLQTFHGDSVEQLANKSTPTLWLQTFHGDVVGSASAGDQVESGAVTVEAWLTLVAPLGVM